MWSRAAAFGYGLFPIFGRLQGVMIILERNESFLAIQRNDGLGFGLPGGFVGRKEPLVEALRRELHEETGLELVSCEELFRFDSDFRFPTTTVVYQGEAEGILRESWEGRPSWLPLSEIEQRVYPPIEPVIEYLRTMKTKRSPESGQV